VQADEILLEINMFKQYCVREQELVYFRTWTAMWLWGGIFLRPISAHLSNCLLFTSLCDWPHFYLCETLWVRS